MGFKVVSLFIVFIAITLLNGTYGKKKGEPIALGRGSHCIIKQRKFQVDECYSGSACYGQQGHYDGLTEDGGPPEEYDVEQSDDDEEPESETESEPEDEEETDEGRQYRQVAAFYTTGLNPPQTQQTQHAIAMPLPGMQVPVQTLAIPMQSLAAMPQAMPTNMPVAPGYYPMGPQPMYADYPTSPPDYDDFGEYDTGPDDYYEPPRRPHRRQRPPPHHEDNEDSEVSSEPGGSGGVNFPIQFPLNFNEIMGNRPINGQVNPPTYVVQSANLPTGTAISVTSAPDMNYWDNRINKDKHKHKNKNKNKNKNKKKKKHKHRHRHRPHKPANINCIIITKSKESKSKKKRDPLLFGFLPFTARRRRSLARSLKELKTAINTYEPKQIEKID